MSIVYNTIESVVYCFSLRVVLSQFTVDSNKIACVKDRLQNAVLSRIQKDLSATELINKNNRVNMQIRYMKINLSVKHYE